MSDVAVLYRGQDPDFAEALRRDKDLQRQMCDPEFNPDAAAFFVFNYCLTQDEDRAGIISALPDPHARGKWLLELLESFDAPRQGAKNYDPRNISGEKSRRMLWTWLASFYNLWAVQWVRGYSALLISKSEDHVDDGGKAERVFSLFSRMRFAYERLPDHVHRDIHWQYMAGSCPSNDAWIIGRAPTKDAGRAGGFGRAWVDEVEFLDWLDDIHRALDPACKLGKVYFSTVNGTANLHARIRKEKRGGWKLLESNWWDDPEHAVGLRPTVEGPERERYGEYWSPWFAAATAGLDEEDIAQEYNRNRQRSSKAICFHSYRKDVHVVTRPRVLAYDARFPLWVGLDFGKARKTAAVGGQPIGDRALKVIFDFEGQHRTTPEIARDLIVKVRRIAPGLPLSEVTLIPDPSGLIGEQGTDIALLDYYLSAGFTNYILPPVSGPGSVKLGIQIGNVALHRREIEIDESCEILLDAFPNYKWPVDRVTREIKRDADPIHGMESHVCDSFRYLVVTTFPVDRALIDIGDEPPGKQMAPRGEHGMIASMGRPQRDGDGGDDDDDDDAPSYLGSRTMTSTLKGKRF